MWQLSTGCTLESTSDTPNQCILGKEILSHHVAKNICCVPCASVFAMHKNGAGFHVISILGESLQHHGASKRSSDHPLGPSPTISGPSSCGRDCTWKRRIFPFTA